MLGPRPGALLHVRGLSRELCVLAFCVFCVSCSDRLTPSRAATIIRHSKAFLSGSVESHPVFDRVTDLLVDPVSGARKPPGEKGRPGEPAESAAKGEEEDTCIAEFSYHWPDETRAGAAGTAGAVGTAGAARPELTARVLLRRSGAGWAIDDERSRALVPTWPQLPAVSSPFSPGAAPPPHGARSR